MDVYGLIGSPVEHSLSPPMHEAAYDELDLDARYVTFEPADGAAAVEAAAELGIAGLNVTIPFKQDVLAAVEPDDAAARVGAVNTIDFGTDPPRGYNTDLAGVRRSFEHHDVDLEGATVVQVGAGGAGRAVAFAATDAGATVRIANRTESKADDLAADVADASDGVATDDGSVSGHGLDAVPELLADADVLVNATSVGMEGDESPVAAEALHGDLVVFDAVYSPLETRLLRDAAAAGAETIDGAWMLLFQGVAAFERWTGRDAPVDAMNRALRAHLE